MKRKGQGIRFQLIAGIVIMTIAGIGLVGFMSIKIVERSALLWKISQAEDTVGFVRASFNPAAGGGQAWGVRFAEAIAKEAGISDFRLSAPDGSPLVAAGRMPSGMGELIYDAGGMEAYMYGGGFMTGIGDFMRVSASVPGAGRVEFVLGLDEVNEDMGSVRKFLALYAIIDSIVIIAFGVYFLSRSILQPLKKLEESAKSIAGGKLFDRADVAVDNEVGSLATSFNSMAERLEDEIKSLERVNLELTTMQEELLRSSTLAAVGRLAAGIAHEIGNPLGALNGYMEILSKGSLDPAEFKDIIARAGRETDRIDSIVRDFLEVARPARKAASPVDLNALLAETIDALSVRGDFSGVDVSVLSGEVPQVMADEGKLRQVFSNLLINAAQAMEGMEKKAITVSTHFETRPAQLKFGRRKSDQPMEMKHGERGYALVRIKDTGAGVAPLDAARIFDPFFTTKEVGKGTGLGLFVSQSIIKACGGEITFRSVEGGAEFTVALPTGEERA
ncbi:MAG: HAMP domain-containing protein [Deltaproteobacteria bacterium]|nr:HAMP domain-containing protein [Deltaproteobacteria bacterium]